ncbi:MAG: helix-turn-helix transcriptional regulator [Bacteroidota bacterium]
MGKLRREDDPLLQNLGKRIKEIRLNKKISQANLALTCEMDKSTLSKIESGKVNISYLILFRLSKCLEVPMSELI